MDKALLANIGSQIIEVARDYVAYNELAHYDEANLKGRYQKMKDLVLSYEAELKK